MSEMWAIKMIKYKEKRCDVCEKKLVGLKTKYCSKRCRLDVHNAKQRMKRAVNVKDEDRDLFNLMLEISRKEQGENNGI